MIIDPKMLGGFIPWNLRTAWQQKTFGRIEEKTPSYMSWRGSVGALPDRCLFYDAQKKATGGKLIPRCFQQIGSCVGAATVAAYMSTICCDVVKRGTVEAIPLLNPFYTWGFGRRLAGMNSPGEGSFGGAQAEAVAKFGMVRADFPGLPAPQFFSKNGKTTWVKWTAQHEKQCSFPKGWNPSEATLTPEANAHQILNIAHIKTVEEYMAACADGKVPTIASMFGTRPKVTQGVLVGEWNDNWAHQMSGGGYWKHATLGYLFPIDNQWSPDAYPECPFLGDIGVDGTCSVTEKTLAKILSSRDTECYVHWDTEDYDAPELDWSGLAA